MRELDRMDRRILELLQANGRMPMTELADKVGLSATPCTERVRRLERDGIITGYHAHVSPAALDKSLLVFVEIRLTEMSAEAFDKVRHEMMFVPEVLECHLVSGEFDYLIKARIGQMSEYRQLLENILAKLPGAAQSRSLVVMEEIKETRSLPVSG